MMRPQIFAEPAMEKRQRQARIIAVSLFISLFFLWGGGYNTAPMALLVPRP